MKYRPSGLRKWKGTTKDDKGCPFPYEVYASYEYAYDHEYRLYVCPWWEDDKFESMKELKAFVSSK